MNKLNLENYTFGYLTVLQRHNNIGGKTAWLCKCLCEKLKVVKTENLRDGSTKSCGCLNNLERSKKAKHMYKNNIKYHPRISSARKVWKSRYSDGDIEFDNFYDLSQMNCYYCNTGPSNISNSAKHDKKASQYAVENGDFIYNGLDRIDSNKAHNLDNVVACCKKCNIAKHNMGFGEFLEWIKDLYNNLYTKNFLM